MQVVNHVVNSYEYPDLEGELFDLVITDGDGTQFLPDSCERISGSEDFMARLSFNGLYLVSANPNQRLSQDRAEILGADGYVIPGRPVYLKHRLFVRAVEEHIAKHGHPESVLVLGNRWVADILVAKAVLRRMNVQNRTSLCIRNQTEDNVHTSKAEQVVNRGLSFIEHIGAVSLVTIGVDELIRPRQQVI